MQAVKYYEYMYITTKVEEVLMSAVTWRGDPQQTDDCPDPLGCGPSLFRVLDHIPNRHNCLPLTSHHFLIPSSFEQSGVENSTCCLFFFGFIYCACWSFRHHSSSPTERASLEYSLPHVGEILSVPNPTNGYHNLFTARFTSTQHRTTETTG